MKNPQEQIRTLQSLVTSMDAVSQETCNQISAIASLAIAAMETKMPYLRPDILAHTFFAVRDMADRLWENISSMADNEGLAFDDPDVERRSAASRAVSEARVQREMARGGKS